MKKNLLLACGVALTTLTIAVPAGAQTLQFDITGSRNATFFLDANPTPDSFTSVALVGDQIFFNDVAGTFGGSPGVATSISFGTNLIANLNINGTSLGFTQFSGPAIFSGSASNPVFSTGTFALNNFIIGGSTLTISQVAPAAVPEPSTWAMMLFGFGLTGVALRYDRRRTVPAYS